jgi:hypothetical protein
MTQFVGPRPGWDEHSAGTVSFEVDLEFWSNSGRPKHIDLDEQGAWLAEGFRDYLRNLQRMPDGAVHRIRYFGTHNPSTSEPIAELDVGLIPTELEEG